MFNTRSVLSLALLLCIAHANVLPQQGEALSKKYRLIPGSKAVIQWKRIFQNERRLKKYGLDKLSKEQREALRDYLVEHAADSPRPIVPGL